MKKAAFTVSSKTARLIGRENISNSNGALVELVKNAYDADATNVVVVFDMPFSFIPRKIQYNDLRDVFEEEEIDKILTFYSAKNNYYIKNENMTSSDDEVLFNLLTSRNLIFVIDNGHGMSDEVLTNKWMNIGTDDKEINSISPNGRIKTGAKGIGRFALDKLSRLSTLYTKVGSINDCLKWSIDWRDLEKQELIEDVFATIEKEQFTYKYFVNEIFTKYNLNYNIDDFENGTTIIMKSVRDSMTKQFFNQFNKNIMSLNPFDTQDTFNIFVHNIHYSEYNFSTNRDSKIEENYDYHIVANFDGKKMKIEIDRNKIDINVREIELKGKKGNTCKTDLSEFWNSVNLSAYPYRLNDMDKIYTVSLELKDLYVEEIRSKFSIESFREIASRVGSFSFDLFFLKSTNADIPISKKINAKRRRELLNNFKGIRIYRDNFKVRPYGEEDSSLYDWLNLSARGYRSGNPAVSSSTAKWRVVPYQVIGNANIGRNQNEHLIDMANRENLEDNDEFAVFKALIIGVIAQFEEDRQYVFREFAKWRKKKEDELLEFDPHDILDDVQKKYDNNNESEIKDDDDLVDNQKEENQEQKSEDDSNSYQAKVEQSLLSIEEERRKIFNENKLLRSFSVSGMVANTFSHELRALDTRIVSLPNNLGYLLNQLLDIKKFEGPNKKNPFYFLDSIKDTHKLLESWIGIIMNAIDKGEINNEEAESHNLYDLVCEIIKNWKSLLDSKKISIKLKKDGDINNCNITKSDLYLIINNFILNSSWFLKDIENRERKIEINFSLKDDVIKIRLYNNGKPMDDKYKKNPLKMFELGESTKVLDNGELGTGIGMWLIKTAVEDNKGTVLPVIVDVGFELEICFPQS